MEAPEKIWINPSMDLPKLNGVIDKDSIQYVHKDTFIKKVVNFLEILGYAYTITDNITKSLYDNIQLIEDFKKYMEE